MQILRSADAAAIADARRRGEFLWVDLLDPSAGEIAQAGAAFGLHPLAVEDAQVFNQGPKVEHFGDSLQLVFYGAHQADAGEPELVETHLLVSREWLLTVRRDACVPLEHLQDADERGDRWIVYRVIDALTDSIFPLVHRLDERIEALEDRVLEGETVTARRDVVELRRTVLGVRRILSAQLDVFDRAADDLSDRAGLGEGSPTYFRDVQNNLRRLTDRADAARERLMAVLQMADNAVVTRVSRVGERLTLIATIFLPLTAISSFFGMNFSWLIQNIESFGTFAGLGLGVPLATGVSLFVYLRRRGYLE